jgi:hypothetical protein
MSGKGCSGGSQSDFGGNIAICNLVLTGFTVQKLGWQYRLSQDCFFKVMALLTVPAHSSTFFHIDYLTGLVVAFGA